MQKVQSDRYDPSIKFSDPISSFNDLTGYSLNVRFLTTIFAVKFKLLDIGVVGPEKIVARWSMEATSRLAPVLPWKPKAVFTGISEYKVDTVSGLITEHIDKWDSIEDNDFLSVEAVRYIATSLTQVKMHNLLQLTLHIVFRVSRPLAIHALIDGLLTARLTHGGMHQRSDGSQQCQTHVAAAG